MAIAYKTTFNWIGCGSERLNSFLTNSSSFSAGNLSNSKVTQVASSLYKNLVSLYNDDYNLIRPYVLENISLPNCSIINKDAFYNCIISGSVSLPNCLRIEDGAMYLSSDLMWSSAGGAGTNHFSSLYFPKIQYIGDNAINGIYSASPQVTFSSLSYIGNGNSMYFYNSEYAYIFLNLPVCTYIGSSFGNGSVAHTHIAYLSAPKCTEIGDNCFAGYSGPSLILPSIRKIGSSCFCNGCFTSIYFPYSNNIEIGESCFMNNPSLKSVTTFNVKKLGANAFTYCRSLYTFKNGEDFSIGAYAFSMCDALTSFSFSKCYYYGFNAFSDCTALWSNMSVCSSYFKYVSGFGGGITLMSYSGTGTYQNTLPTGVNGINCNINYLASSYNDYYDLKGVYNCAFSDNDLLKSFVASKCEYIGESAFHYARVLSYVSVGSIKCIGSYAFFGCSRLSEMVADFSYLESIGERAFYNCSSLKSLGLSKVKYIGSYAFYNCSIFSSPNFSECEYVGSYAFYNCKSITSFDIPKVSQVGAYAFTNCTSATSINLPECLSIGYCAFNQCTKLTTVSIPKCKSIGFSAFMGCYSLSSVTISDVEYVGQSAFYAMGIDFGNLTLSKLADVGEAAFILNSISILNLPNIKYIGDQAFACCTNLSIISLSACESLGAWAFSSISTLQSVYISGSFVCGMSSYLAFYNCNSSFKIYVPSSLYLRYKRASYWSNYESQIYSY